MTSVWVLVVEGMFDTGLAAVLDTLGMANELAPLAEETEPFTIHLASVRKRVRTQQGMVVPSVSVDDLPDPEVILVPAFGAKTPDTLAAALQQRDVSDARDVLLDAYDHETQLAAACTGTYLLASTGLIDGRAATTTWWLANDFRARFPEVTLDESKMVVEDGAFLTAGAALAHVDLALWMIRQRSPALAQLVARYLLVDDRPSQMSYAILDHLSHADPLVERFEVWARAHLHDFSMAAAARAIGSSERTLQRRLRKVLGRTPIEYVRDLRVERAIHLLRTSDQSVDEIAEAVGYGEGVTLRTLLREKTGRGIRELRRGD